MLYKLKEEAKQFFPEYGEVEMDINQWKSLKVHDNLLCQVVPTKDVRLLFSRENNDYNHRLDFIVYGFKIEDIDCDKIEKLLLEYLINNKK